MKPQPSSPVSSRRDHWWSWVVMWTVLYIVAAPPALYLAARIGLVRNLDADRPRSGAVDAGVAPARWLYEESPLKPVLQPWAEFWYDVLLT